MVNAEFLADVEIQRRFRMGRDLPGHPVGEVGVHAPLPEHFRQLTALRVRMGLELEPLLADLGGDQFVLRRHRDELARRHREGAGGQARQPGQHQRLMRSVAAADARQQRDVGDEPVHGAEHGGPEPAAGHVPVLVAM